MIPRKTDHLVAFFLLCISVNFHVGKSDDPLTWTCPDDAVYNVNTTHGRAYRNNVQSLLSVLTSNATIPNGFYNFTAGTTTTAAAYGLFLCRGDITPRECQTCVTAASSSILEICPNGTYALIWYWECMLSYSNQSIFSKLDTADDQPWTFYNTANVSDPALLNRVLGDAFDQITTRAASDDVPGKKFAVQEANYSALQKFYTLGQCTPDLSNLDCEICLRTAVSNLPACCNGSVGGSVIFPSCNIEYETYRWYRVPSPPPSPLPPPSPKLPSTRGVSPDPPISDDGGSSTKTIVAIVVPAIVSIAAFVVVIFCIARKAKKRKMQKAIREIPGAGTIPTDVESLRYKFSEVEACTSNFSDQNIIGQGGFGIVYKGTLPNGQIVAVKRLSEGSAQGGVEFINEIALVAKLQHRNLVKLLGYCLEGEEKILMYEFVINKSLDCFLFDSNKQPLLDWSTRYKIIGGTARGILYLHEDSRIKIIHRDLKASNVLLDENMNPKIADFGMARLFEIDQSEGNTSKIAGTFGYMAPEYVFHGMLSVKSDVFSFGVLVLEIVSGKKNSNFQGSGDDDLLSYVWKLWRDGTPLEVIDPAIKGLYNKDEVIRCIHIGLLCVEEDVERRPTMTSVVLMLNSYFVALPNPNPPSYFGRSRAESLPREIVVRESDPSSHPQNSINGTNITEVYPR